MLSPRACLSQKPHPTPADQTGGVQRTIGEAAAYVLALPHAESCNRWRRAAQLLLDQADVAAVSKQAKLALVYDPRFDIGAMPGR
jgi:hypothetical protein